MQPFLFATTNKQKFGIGKHIFHTYGLTIERVELEVDEIQGEDPKVIITDKVQKAYNQLQKPVIVSDDSWTFPALNGFPGAYMKSMNYWFKPEDFIVLMRDKVDKTVHINQYLAYADGQNIQIFHNDIHGTVTESPRGSFGPPIMKVVVMDGDKGLTISEAYDNGKAHDEARLANPNDAWRQLAEWLKRSI